MSPTAEMIQFPVSDATHITRDASITVETTRSLRVVDATSYTRAGELVTGLRALSKRITAFFEDDVRRAHELHRSLTRKRSEAVDPVDKECARLTREMGAWKTEEDRKAREAAARLAREEQERQRAIALEEAAALEAQGEQALAESVVEQAIAMPAPVIPIAPTAPKVDGISYRSVWRHEVVDVALVPREYLVIDEAKIAAVVRATKGTLPIPGVRVYEEQIAVVRSA